MLKKLFRIPFTQTETKQTNTQKKNKAFEFHNYLLRPISMLQPYIEPPVPFLKVYLNLVWDFNTLIKKCSRACL